MENEKPKTLPIDAIIIEKAGNGFILRWVEQMDDDFQREEAEVIEDVDEERKALTSLLERIAEWAGYNYDKYGKENLSISWDKKGHKV